MADIPGTSTERMHFHRFRVIGEEALGIRHVHSGLFWRQIVPQYCAEVPAVRHAYISLSAAHLHFHVAGNKPTTTDAAGWCSRSVMSKEERFILQQYNLALENMGRDCNSSGGGGGGGGGGTKLPLRRRYGITMMCCVAFFCMEMLRGHVRAALAHLRHGIRMMAEMPEDVADILHNPAKWSRGLDTSHVRVAYMMSLLRRWEVAVGHLVDGFEPVLAAQAYETRRVMMQQQQQGLAISARSVEEVQDAVEDFCQDVKALVWLARSSTTNSSHHHHQHHRHGDGDLYWRDPMNRLQYWVLKQRCDRIGELFAAHQDGGGCSYRRGTREYRSIQVGLLRYRVDALALDLLPFEGAQVLSPYAEAERIQELVAVAEKIRAVHSSSCSDAAAAEEASHADVGVIPTLHAIVKHCRDAATRKRVLFLIHQWPTSGSFWDGPVMRAVPAF